MAMRIFSSSFILVVVMNLFCSCEKDEAVRVNDCCSSLNSPTPVEHQLLVGTCLDTYFGSDSQFKISSEIELKSIMDQFECEELPTINFSEKDLLVTIISFLGTREYEESLSIYREGSVIEVLHCANFAPVNYEEPVAQVENYLSHWILVDKLSVSDSVIFTVK